MIYTLCEMCPNTEFFLVRIFPHSDWIWRDTKYLSVFSPNAGKYGPEKTPYLDTFHAVDSNHIFRKYFYGKICTNSRPLFIIFNHLFGCPEVKFGPLRWQRVSLAYLMLIIVLYFFFYQKEPRCGIGSQNPDKHISRFRTGSF